MGGGVKNVNRSIIKHNTTNYASDFPIEGVVKCARLQY